jgi:1,4-dihydroxy-2-naphthoyl-CoA hydrolase
VSSVLKILALFYLKSNIFSGRRFSFMVELNNFIKKEIEAMPIWKTKTTLERLDKLSKNTLLEHLGIKVTEIGHDQIKASMPVDHRTRQPMGLLHGGASVALAESIGSIAASLAVGPKKSCVGLEINANHLRTVKKGTVTGIAKPVHVGRSTHVWDIRIYDEQENTVCISRLTMAVIDSPEKAGKFSLNI